MGEYSGPSSEYAPLCSQLKLSLILRMIVRTEGFGFVVAECSRTSRRQAGEANKLIAAAKNANNMPANGHGLGPLIPTLTFFSLSLFPYRNSPFF